MRPPKKRRPDPSPVSERLAGEGDEQGLGCQLISAMDFIDEGQSEPEKTDGPLDSDHPSSRPYPTAKEEEKVEHAAEDTMLGEGTDDLVMRSRTVPTLENA